MLTLNGFESEVLLLACGLVMEIREDLDQGQQSRWSQVQHDKSSQLTTLVKTRTNCLLYVYMHVGISCQRYGNSGETIKVLQCLHVARGHKKVTYKKPFVAFSVILKLYLVGL